MTILVKDMTARDWWVFLTSTHGRIRRFDYIVKFWLLVIGISCFAFLIDYSYLGRSVFDKNTDKYASLLVNLIFLWPGIAVTVRRLHDLNLRGGWLLVPAGLSLLVFLLGASGLIFFGSVKVMIVMGIAYITVNILTVVAFLVLLFVKGTRGDNRFGPDPLEQALLPKEWKTS